MTFLYSFGLALLNPASLSVLLLLVSALVRRRKVPSRICFSFAVAILIVCGNSWVSQGLARQLEWHYLPLDPVPQADCILVLSGGLSPRIPPRPTIEVQDAGDRVLYAVNLFRQGKAPRVVCTGEKGSSSIVLRPLSEDMAEFLETLGVPKEAIMTEKKAQNTHQHGVKLAALLHENGFKRVLLVTSAMHMPRSVGVFHASCPGIEFIPAPTDFRVVERLPAPWYYELRNLIPTPSNLVLFSEAMHEYLGILYYRMRGWM